MAYEGIGMALGVATIFEQILNLDDYILSDDYYHQGYAIGKIAANLGGLTKTVLIETDHFTPID